MADAAQEAAQVQAQSAQRAADVEMQMYQQAVQREQPWITGGQTALNQLGGLYGLPGYTAQDPTKTLQGTPGYQWLLGQGTQARDLSAASRGLALSGAQQKGLTDFGQNLGQTYAWNPYIQGLTGMSNAGQQGAGQTGAWGMNAGQNIGQDYLMQGQAQGQGIWNAARANQNQGSGWGSILGLGLGALMAPFTGGTSLIGSGIGALSNWFGGGGGGGGGSLQGTTGYGTSGWGDWAGVGNWMGG